MSKSRSNNRRQAHERDEFVKRARTAGYRSRASFKLIEMADKYGLLRPGMHVVDLGAAPGGWSQVAASRVGEQGTVMALDVLPMESLPGVTFIGGDFAEEDTLARLLDEIGSSSVDLVLSDMAPNLSGMKAIDQPRSMHLVELAIDLTDRILRKGGGFVVKCFEGEGIAGARAAIRQRFGNMANFKPKSSRDKSREIYIIGLEYNGTPSA